MLKSVEAIIEKNGEVHLMEPIHLSSPCRAIVTILDKKSDVIAETALLRVHPEMRYFLQGQGTRRF